MLNRGIYMKRLLFLLPFFITGCFQTREDQSMTVQIRSSKKTNRGTPLYVIVKETTMADFLIDDYHEIATQSFWKEEDESKLLKKVLVPGKTDKLTVPLPGKEKAVGLYFIFTSPGECWKFIVDDPDSKKVKVLLGEDQYEAINVYQS